MGIDNMRRWLSIIFQKIGGLYRRNSGLTDVEGQKKLRRFFSSDNTELPETQCHPETGKSSICSHLLFEVDLTQVLISAYQKNYNQNNNKTGDGECRIGYATFERYLVSKIVSHLTNINTETCILCGLGNSGFNSWSYSSPKSTSFNPFDAPKNHNQNQNQNQGGNPGLERVEDNAVPSRSICQCAKELDICQLLDGILKYTKSNPSKSIRIVLLYDSRNLNPLSRSIVNAARYSEQSNTVSITDILNWFKKQEANSATQRLCNFGYDIDTDANSCRLNIPIMSSSFLRGYPQLKNDEFLQNYLKPRFLLFTIENWLSRLNNRIGDFLSTLAPSIIPPNSNIKSCCYHYQSKPKFNPLTNFELVLDSLPVRSEEMYLACKSEKSFSFRNPVFTKNFFDFYGNTVGTSQSKISFYMDLMLEEGLRTGNSLNVDNIDSEGQKPKIFSENKDIVNLLSWYPMVTRKPEEISDGDLIQSEEVGYFSVIDQKYGITNNIGESDIKILPYIVSFIDDIVGGHNSIIAGDVSSRYRVIIDSEDADLIPICLLFVSNNVCNEKRIGNILVSNHDFILSDRFSIIIDRGVKMNHDNYKKLKCDSEKIEDKQSFMKNASGKSSSTDDGDDNPDTNFSDLLDFDFQERMDTNGDSDSALVMSSDETPAVIIPEKQNRHSIVQILETMSEKDLGNIRMVDVGALYSAFCNYLTSDFIEQFVFYMFLNGCDYVNHPAKMGVEKFVSTFETYSNQKPFNLFSNYPSSGVASSSFSSSSSSSSSSSIGESSSANNQRGAYNGPLLVRHCIDKKHKKYVWVCNTERAFVFAILLYHTTLPKTNLAPTKKTILQTLTNLLNSSPVDRKGLSSTVTAQSIYTDFRKMVMRKNPKVTNFWTENEVIGEMYRCTWTVNYYLGCEFDCIHSVERKMNGSIWGWTIAPFFNGFKEQIPFSGDLINFLESYVVEHSNGTLSIGTTPLTWDEYWKYVRNESNTWKKYLKCIQILQIATQRKQRKEGAMSLRIVPDNMLLFDHYCFY